MFIDDNPDADLEDILAHFGVRGMHWGIRRGKKVTGVSRKTGAMIDKNARQIHMIKGMKSGTDHKAKAAVGRAILGKERANRRWEMNINELTAQNARLKSGHVMVRDRLARQLLVTPIDQIISRTPANA